MPNSHSFLLAYRAWSWMLCINCYILNTFAYLYSYLQYTDHNRSIWHFTLIVMISTFHYSFDIFICYCLEIYRIKVLKVGYIWIYQKGMHTNCAHTDHLINCVIFSKPFCPWCDGQVVWGAGSSSLATYGVIHISLGHITAEVYILGISCHLFICTFHVTLLVVYVSLESL